MLKSLEIRGYRGFSSYRMSNLARVNLVVGKNNCGKTSVLEAIEVLVTGGDPLGCVNTNRPRYDMLIPHRHWLEGRGIKPVELTEAQYERIAPLLPKQRGNVTLSNLQVLNAILFVAEHGCKWRGLPERFGNWHTIYTRMNRWSKSGVLDRVFERLQRDQIVQIKVEAFGLDSTSVKVHPDGTGALKKTARSPSASPAEAGTPRFIWLPRMLERRSPSRSPPATRTTPRPDANS